MNCIRNAQPRSGPSAEVAAASARKITTAYCTQCRLPALPAELTQAVLGLCYSAGMDRDAVIAKLKEHQAEFKRLGVEHLYLFGSTARGEAREDSDVDLFFDHPLGSLGLFELMDVKDAATRILGRKTDIMTWRSLHPALRERIEASALQVF